MIMDDLLEQPAVEQAEVVAIEVPETPEIRTGTEAEQRLIEQFEREMMVPSWLKDAWATWEDDRTYINSMCFGDKDSRALTVNLAARAIQSKMTRIEPTEADMVIQSEGSVGSAEWAKNDAYRATKAKFDEMGMPPDPRVILDAGKEAERVYRLQVEKRERFSNGAESIVRRQLRTAGFTNLLRRSGIDAFTVGIAWAKTGWQSDYNRDSFGSPRIDDSQDQIALLQVRAAEFAAGWFDENDPKYQELLDLSDYCRQFARIAMDGGSQDMRLLDVSSIAGSPDQRPLNPGWLSEPSVWVAPTVSIVRPENIRWDWRVKPWEASTKGEWIAEQILMDRDEAAARFKLSPQEAALLGTGSSITASGANGTNPETMRTTRTPGSEPGEPGKSHYESSEQDGKVVVWDRYDFKRGHRYTWCAGLRFFSVKEVVEMYDDCRGPYECLAFNDLTGCHVPVSETRFLRKLQDAINQRLTDGQESLWASMKRYIVKKDAFTPEEMMKFRASIPHDVIECEDPGKIAESWQEIASDDWTADKYSLEQLFQLFELVMGMSMSQLGIVDVANTATEARIAENSSSANSDRHAILLSEFATKIASRFLHYDVRYLNEKQAKRLAGSDQIVWPSPASREELVHGLRLEVQAAGNRRNARAQEAASLNAALDALRKVAAVKAELMAVGLSLDEMAFIQPILRIADVRGPAREAVKPLTAPAGGMPPPPMGAAPEAAPEPQSQPGPPQPPLLPQGSQNQQGMPPVG